MAIRFDADTDQITADGWGGSVATVCVWARLEADRNAEQSIFLVTSSSGGGGSTRALLETDTTGTQLVLYDSAFATQTGPNMAVGTWYCFGIVMNGTAWSLRYGTTPSSLTEVTATRTSFTGPGTFLMSLTAEWWSGDVANLKIWTRALTGTEIADELATYTLLDSTNIRRHHKWNASASLVPDAGAGSNFTAGATSVTFVSGPPALELSITCTGIASAQALGSPTVSQHIACTGIASAEAFGSTVVTQGQTIAAFGVASGAAIGSHSIDAFPFLVQTGYHFIPSATFSFDTPFAAQTATADNAIVFCLAGDKDIGTLSLTGSGWSTPVNLRTADVSLVIAWKIAAGGETGVAGSFTSGNTSGCNSFALEWHSSLTGYWVDKGHASNNSDGTNVTSWATGTTSTLAGSGVAIAAWAVDSIQSNSVDSVSNSFVERFFQGAGLSEAGLWVASKNVIGGTTTSSTLTRAAPVTADQTSGGVLVLGTAQTQTLTPTGIATGQALGSPAIFALYPTGIASAVAFGTATVAVSSSLNVSPSGIASGAAFGQHVVFIGFLIQVSGIATAAAFGTATVTHPARLFKFGGFNPTAVYLGEDPAELFLGEDVVWQ